MKRLTSLFLLLLFLVASAQDWQSRKAQALKLVNTEPAKAIELLEDLVQSPGIPKQELGLLYGFLGKARGLNKDYEGCLKAFDQAIVFLRKGPIGPLRGALLWKANALTALNRPERALPVYEEILETKTLGRPLSSFDLVVFYRMALLAEQQKNPDLVRASLRFLKDGSVLESKTDKLGKKLWNLALLANRNREYAASEWTSEKALELGDPSLDSLYLRKVHCQALKAQEKDQEAYLAFQKLLPMLTEPAGLAWGRLSLGVLLERLGRHRESLEHLTDLDTAPIEDQSFLLEAREAKASSLRFLGRFDEAIEEYGALIEAQSSVFKADALSQRAACFQAVDRTEEALRDSLACLATLEAERPTFGDKVNPRMGSEYARMSMTLFMMQRETEALSASNQALELLNPTRGQRLGLALGGMARILFAQGDYQMSLSVGDKSISVLMESPKSNRAQAQAYTEQAQRFSSLGKNREAAYCFDAALPIYMETLGPEHTSTLFSQMGKARMLHNMGRSREALSLFEQLQKTLERKSHKPVHLAWVYSGIATVHRDLGSAQRALEYYSLARDFSRTVRPDRNNELNCLVNMAHVELNQNRFQKAYELARPAVEEILRKKSGKTLSDIFTLEAGGRAALGLFHTNRKPEKLAEANRWLSEAVESSGEIREKVDVNSRLQQTGSLHRLFPRAVEAAVLTGDLKRAVELTELAGSRTLLEKLAGISKPSKSRAEIRDSLQQAGVEIKESKAAGVVELRTLSKLRKTLRPQEIAIYFLLGPRRSHGFLMDQESLAYFPLPSEAKLNEAASRFSKEISGGKSRAELLGQTLVSGQDRLLLGKMLWKDFPRDWLPRLKGKTLVMVPTGRLLEVPLEALPPLPGEEGDFLLEQHPILYTPSISMLGHLRERPQREVAREALILGDPVYSKQPKSTLASRYRSEDKGLSFPALPFTRIETENLARKFKGKKFDLLLGEKAKESAVKALNPGEYKYLHFACHGILGLKRGLGPSLVLNQEEGDEDGFLTSAEVSTWALKAQLVVLSACQTGRGRYLAGEGVESMARSFLSAGANSVLMSLWMVDDRSTSELMENFYDGMLERGGTPAVSLREAKLTLIKKGRPPGHWAPFILVGDGG